LQSRKDRFVYSKNKTDKNNTQQLFLIALVPFMVKCRETLHYYYAQTGGVLSK